MGHEPFNLPNARKGSCQEDRMMFSGSMTANCDEPCTYPDMAPGSQAKWLSLHLTLEYPKKCID